MLRSKKLLDTRILVVEYDLPSPFRECQIGRVKLMSRDTYLAVFMDHETYTHTNDMVFACQGTAHLFSRWPHVNWVLEILRTEMVLDDLAAA